MQSARHVIGQILALTVGGISNQALNIRLSAEDCPEYSFLSDMRIHGDGLCSFLLVLIYCFAFKITPPLMYGVLNPLVCT